MRILLYENFIKNNAEEVLNYLKSSLLAKHAYITGSPTRIIECTLSDGKLTEEHLVEIDSFNWYIANIDGKRYRKTVGDGGDYVIKPKYGTVVEKKKFLYHVSPSINDESILVNGIIPKIGMKKDSYPPRIYFVKSPDVINTFIKQLKWYHEGTYTIWEVNLKNINTSLYLDEEVILNSYYIADTVIEPVY